MNCCQSQTTSSRGGGQAREKSLGGQPRGASLITSLGGDCCREYLMMETRQHNTGLSQLGRKSRD